MQVTDVRIKKADGDSAVKAFASVTFDDEFVVHNVRVVEGKNGTYVNMPSRKVNTGEFKDICHPVNTEMRDKISKAVMEAYEKAEEEQPA